MDRSGNLGGRPECCFVSWIQHFWSEGTPRLTLSTILYALTRSEFMLELHAGRQTQSKDALLSSLQGRCGSGLQPEQRVHASAEAGPHIAEAWQAWQWQARQAWLVITASRACLNEVIMSAHHPVARPARITLAMGRCVGEVGQQFH